MVQIYGTGANSSIGTQFNTSYWDRKSLIDAAEQMFFSPLADSKSMPAHYGKELKVFYYVPLLDDRNISDQGIDASGALAGAGTNVPGNAGYNPGNLYGSSKDAGTIMGRMPTLTEEGGRVNRVGFTRLERSGSLTEYGFFSEFTEDSMTFDTDSELYGHMSREMLAGANEITEDLLQLDLLSAAQTVVYTGASASIATVNGNGTVAAGTQSIVTYKDLRKLGIILDDNRTPKNTKIIKGSRMTDTMTVNASRVLFIGSELQLVVENLVDNLGNAAFIPVRKYADAATIMNGEIGSVADFRIVVVPNMMYWPGAGAAEGANADGMSATGGNFDVYPMLVVGGESFATVGLQSSGKKGGKQKFKIIVRKPGTEMATVSDPYGKVGFSSISFYHGFIALRPERIGITYSVAPA